MRIALRPSGGRGDFELAGSYNGLHASDLLEKRQLFQISPVLLIDGKAKAHRLAGKPRIRPELSEGGRHAYVFLSALLLLPSSRRELSVTPDTPTQLRAGEYTVAGIDVDVVSNDADRVTFAPTAVWARSRGGLLKIDFVERMAVVTALWNIAAVSSGPIASLMSDHKLSAGYDSHDRVIRAASAIQKHFGTNEDVMPALLRAFGLAGPSSLALTAVSEQIADFESEDNDTLPAESQRERVRKWRRQADRGPGARDFSVQVRQAYDFRCLFSGERFPKLSLFDSAGVDGAHILPWSVHQLNSVANGICLCKQCHWAFDNGLLHLDFDTDAKVYLLSIPKRVEIASKNSGFDLDHFQSKTGKIDAARLPANPKFWPSPAYLQELNRNA